MKIVYLDRATLSSNTQLRAPAGQHDWQCFDRTSNEQVLERCQTAQIIATNKVPITRAMIEACPSVKHIAVSATGYNCIDVDACRENGVSVSNIPSYASITVPEHVMNLALTLRRELLEYRAQVIAGNWQKSDTFCLFDKPIRDLRGATLGIIGLGDLGLATAKLAKAFGMQVIYNSPSEKHTDVARRVDFATLLSTADVVSLHCSLTESTQNLIGPAELAQMQPHSILINTARGGIADEEAVVNAVQNEQIGGIGFDVLSEEPPKNDSPLLDIAARNNVIITPHIAWASERALQSVADILIDNIDAFIAGQPQNIVN